MFSNKNRTLHHLTGFFARKAMDKLYVVNEHASHIEPAQMAEKYIQGTRQPLELKNVYVHFSTTTANSLSKIMDNNCQTHYVPLLKYGAKVIEYNKTFVLDSKSQNNPDVIIDLNGSSFKDQRAHGIDEKACENPIDVENRAYSRISVNNYRKALNAFEKQIKFNNPELTLESVSHINNAIKAISASCEIFEEHVIVWAQNLNHFPNGYIPPIKLPHKIATIDFTSEALDAFEKSSKKMQLVSDWLYEHQQKNPEVFRARNPKNDLITAIELWENSELQRILAS